MVWKTVAGWAGIGFLTRSYQLAILKRHMFDNFGGHLAFMTGFGALGYYFDGLTKRQDILIQQKEEQIRANRERYQEKLAARKEQHAEESEE